MSTRAEVIETIRQLTPTLNLSDLSRVVLKLVRDSVGADRGTIFVIDRKRGEIRSVAADRVISEISMPLGFGIAGSVGQTGEIIDTYNPNYDKRFDEKYEAILNYDTKDIYCMPVLNAGGLIVGVLQLLNRTRPFTQEDTDFLLEVTNQLSPLLEKSASST